MEQPPHVVEALCVFNNFCHVAKVSVDDVGRATSSGAPIVSVTITWKDGGVWRAEDSIESLRLLLMQDLWKSTGYPRRDHAVHHNPILTRPKPEGKPEGKSVVKPVGKPEVKPVGKPEGKPEVKPEVKRVVKPEGKPVGKPEVKPVGKPKDEDETYPKGVWGGSTDLVDPVRLAKDRPQEKEMLREMRANVGEKADDIIVDLVLLHHTTSSTSKPNRKLIHVRVRTKKDGAVWIREFSRKEALNRVLKKAGLPHTSSRNNRKSA